VAENVLRIAVVTGASRGAGKGIAIALGEAGATVYVTGRSVADSDSPFGGTVSETAALVTQAGGTGIAVSVDHADDDAVAALFARFNNPRFEDMTPPDLVRGHLHRKDAATNALRPERRAVVR